MQSKSAVRILALVLLACAMPSLVSASSARIEGLGFQGDYVMDYSNVLTYPSAIVRYQNLVYGDLGVKDVSGGDLSDFENNNQNPRLDDADRALGLLLGNLWGGRAGAFGVYVEENAAPLSPALGAAYFNRNANEAWNIVWGYKFSNMALGLEFNRSFSSIEAGTQTVKPFTGPGSFIAPPTSIVNARQIFNFVASAIGSDDWNTLGVGGGVSFDFGDEGKPNWVDLSGEVRSYTFEISDTDPTVQTNFEDDGGISFGINGRAHLAAGSDVHVMPVVNYYRIDMSTKFTDGLDPTNNAAFDNKVTGLNAGICGQWNVRESDWVYLGAAFQNVDIDFVDAGVPRDPGDDGHAEFEYTTIPNVFAALESNVWSWLTLRVGASKPFFSKLKLTDFTVTPNDVTEIKDSPLQYSVGAGFHLGRIDLDALLNQDWPFTGGWLASGRAETPFSRLSATYRW